ncbi:MAG TPA: cytochrome D1 domain-containing protein [Thermoanaerobaculia bacterium]|nr:cytochrome D1 domain-containing protein [Thermoanaerobaculia bacterium]
MRVHRPPTALRHVLTLAAAFSFAATLPLVAAAGEPGEPTPSDGPAQTARGSDAPPTGAPLEAGTVREGVSVAARVEPLAGGFLQEGGHARVSFTITDTHTGRPYPALYPAAWMDLLPAGTEEEGSCTTKVESFVGGSILAQSELDLNVFYVLALNDDRTITVVDPLFGFGGSKLLALVRLPSQGEDWALSLDQERLFVSLPEDDGVAVVDTATWEIVATVATGPRPGRLALQGDGAFLWVAHGGGEAPGGVSVIDVAELAEVARIPTGAGARDVALAADDRFAYVANAAAGTVTVVDGRTRQVAAQVPTGRRPVTLAFSPAADALWVGDEVDGTLTALDADSHQVRARVELAPGLVQVRVTPGGGRWALAVNPTTDELFVVDSATGRLVQVGEMESGPDQVAFSDELAYVRHRGSETVLAIPLAILGQEGTPVQVVDFPGGSAPPGRNPRPSPAAGMVQAPGAPAMLVANTEDEAIYFYKEGMAAPMGSFKNYGHRPRAVAVVDRSLQETTPGVYETTVRLRRPGRYELAFFLDTPRIVHCFPLTVAENPVMAAARRPEMIVRPLTTARVLPAGQPVDLRFRVTDSLDRGPMALSDFTVMAMLAGSNWFERALAEAEGDGIYRLRFTPPRAGVYYVYVASPSRGAGFHENPYQIFRAVDGDSAPGDGEPEGGGRS